MNQIAKMTIFDTIDGENRELEEIHICTDAD